MLCHIHWFLPPGALCTVVQRDSFLCQNHFKPRGTSNLSSCLLDLNWIQTAVSAPGSQVTILPMFFFHGFYCHSFPLQYIMENQRYCCCFNVRLVILWGWKRTWFTYGGNKCTDPEFTALQNKT